VIHFSHVGICVSDLDASLRFYQGALGFDPGPGYDVGPAYGTLMEIDGVRLRSQFLSRDGVSIELLAYQSPGVVGEPVRRPVNQRGLTHLCLRVDDVDQVARAVRDHGGTVHEHTRTRVPVGGGAELDLVYCTDPDGTRVELMSARTAAV
jgi:catechol 2,3-dioxygenase-like lactoylglutathione lyase family enzyme